MFASAFRSKPVLTLLLIGGAWGLAALAAPPAAARSSVHVGVGVGFPVYPSYGYSPGYGYTGYGYSGYGYRNYGYRPYYGSYGYSYYPHYPRRAWRRPSVVYSAPAAYYDPYYEPPRPYTDTPLVAEPSSGIYQASDGQYCREYQSRATIGGRSEITYGTACQDADGKWRIR